ncbi:unnamed protein product, partial [Strongylus vulgaris]
PPQITIRREERVYAQLSALFNVACSFTRIVAQPPLSLQVLINCLAEFLLEVQKMRVGILLDDMPADNYKSNTVYAYAQPTQRKKLPGVSDSSIAVGMVRAGPSRIDTQQNQNGSCSVENELFNATSVRGRGVGSHAEVVATAKQINGMSIRKNAEKRLTSRENPTNAANLSIHSTEHQDSSKNAKKKRGSKRR